MVNTLPNESFITMSRSIDHYDPPIETRTDDILNLSEMVNRFMDVKRVTLRGGEFETDGEHTLHLQFLAVAYASRYHPELDLGKVGVYGLVRDFVEVYAGDVNSLKATPEAIARKALVERVALDRLEGELGDAWSGFLDLIKAYEELGDAEARYVKSFDKCDALVSHTRCRGEALLRMGILSAEEFSEHAERVGRRMKEYADEFPDVMAIRDELVGRVMDISYSAV